jgi:hypothetical protein
MIMVARESIIMSLILKEQWREAAAYVQANSRPMTYSDRPVPVEGIVELVSTGIVRFARLYYKIPIPDDQAFQLQCSSHQVPTLLAGFERH